MLVHVYIVHTLYNVHVYIYIYIYIYTRVYKCIRLKNTRVGIPIAYMYFFVTSQLSYTVVYYKYYTLCVTRALLVCVTRNCPMHKYNCIPPCAIAVTTFSKVYTRYHNPPPPPPFSNHEYIDYMRCAYT